MAFLRHCLVDMIAFLPELSKSCFKFVCAVTCRLQNILLGGDFKDVWLWEDFQLNNVTKHIQNGWLNHQPVEIQFNYCNILRSIGLSENLWNLTPISSSCDVMLPSATLMVAWHCTFLGSLDRSLSQICTVQISPLLILITIVFWVHLHLIPLSGNQFCISLKLNIYPWMRYGFVEMDQACERLRQEFTTLAGCIWKSIKYICVQKENIS